MTSAGTSTSSTCTLAQAIAAANDANGVNAVAIGSATTDLGFCNFFPPGAGATAGSNLVIVEVTAITLTTTDNYWYGPNALPPIASPITILPSGGALKLVASHVGDPTPTTANAFRFFYVSGGFPGELPAGSLTLVATALQGGYAKGGDSGVGGGGAGMGGAIFNQGSLTLRSASLIGNTAQGGSSTGLTPGYGGGGMGEDGATYDGGGFGGSLGGSFGGNGSAGDSGGGNDSGGGGGGGGFISGSSGGATGANGHGAPGGGYGGLGGAGGEVLGPAAGDGGGGGSANVLPSNGSSGGSMSLGGSGATGYGSGGGGGVGGGGGSGHYGGGGGGGFGAGGGFSDSGMYGGGGSGGFGGGAGGDFDNQTGGFGGGDASESGGTGGAGMGGAIFNHTGTVSLLNVTATSNTSRGGAGSCPCDGSGLGAVLFNLNGNVMIDFSTLAGNTLAGTNGATAGKGPEDGTVYSLAYGNKIQDGTASTATLTISNSIIVATRADGGDGNDVLVNAVNGAQANYASFVAKAKNFVLLWTIHGNSTATGTSVTQADPHVGGLSTFGASPNRLPVLPIGGNSLAYNAAPNCLEGDGVTTLTVDERGAARPYGGQCDVGAYEFDGDYIFADGVEVKL